MVRTINNPIKIGSYPQPVGIVTQLSEKKKKTKSPEKNHHCVPNLLTVAERTCVIVYEGKNNDGAAAALAKKIRKNPNPKAEALSHFPLAEIDYCVVYS